MSREGWPGKPDRSDARGGFKSARGGGGFNSSRGGSSRGGSFRGDLKNSRGGGFKDSRGGYKDAEGGGFKSSRGGFKDSRGGGFKDSRGGFKDSRGGGFKDSRGGFKDAEVGEFKSFRGGFKDSRGGGFKESRGGFDDTEVRIHRGDKPVKTDAQLARKKPNPAGPPRGYSSGSQGVRGNIFEDEHDRRPRERGPDRSSSPRTRGFDGGPSRNSGFGAPSRNSSFGDRGDDRSSHDPNYVKTEYPSLSFEKPKFSRDRQESDFGNRNSDRQKRSDFGRTPNERQRESYSTSRRTEPRTDPSESTFGSRPSYPARKSEGRQHTSDAEEYTPRRSTKTFESDSNTTPSSGPFTMRRTEGESTPTSGPFTMKRTPRESSGKSYEDSSTGRARSSPDIRIPISIPYTTPASEFLYGTSVVEAALLSRRTPRRQHYKLYIYNGENRVDIEKDANVERLARKQQVEIVKVSGDGLRLMDKMSAGRPHNGYVLEASPLPKLPVTSLGEVTFKDDQLGLEVTVDYQSREDAAINGDSTFVRIPKDRLGRKPMVLFLDGIVDPGNLGGIIRTASFLGVSAVAISARNSAPFSPVVLKASSGASENIAIFSVSKPANFIQASKEAGWRTFAAVAPSTNKGSHSSVTSMSTDELVSPLSENPCILMLGGEGDGLHANLRNKANVELYIPGSGRSHTVDSLNVSVATGILCNAFLGKGKPENVLSRVEAGDSPESDLF